MTERITRNTTAGPPVGRNQNGLTAGPRGPLLVEDWHLFERHVHFNRERIPERVVHAGGRGPGRRLMVVRLRSQILLEDLRLKTLYPEDAN
jgi:catalase